MYLSRVELDPTRRSTMTALAAPQKFHGAVESAFSGERRRRLWRLDRLGEKLYLLLLSEEMPDLSGVVQLLCCFLYRFQCVPRTVSGCGCSIDRNGIIKV